VGRDGNARGGSAAGAKDNDDGETPSVAQATSREDLVRDLAAFDDWRERVAELKLPPVEALALRVECLRHRIFHATEVGIARAREQQRRRDRGFGGARGAR
jgi:hypothetical protein